MNWLKDNPFVAGLVAVVLVGGGVLGFFLSGMMSSFTDTQATYAQAVQKLHGLQNRVPFPDEGNLKKAADLRDAYRSNLDSLIARLSALQTPEVEGVTPQQFQDDLRAAVNDLTKRAEDAKVELPEGFYLGFDEYRAAPPLEKAVPALARQLRQLTMVVGDLIGQNPENPVTRSIDSFSRDILPEERGAVAEPPARRGNAPATTASSMVKMPFSVSFSAEQGKFRIALNTLLKFPQFLIIRSILVENSNPVGPPIVGSETPADGSSTSALFLGANESPNTLNVLLGRELVKVQLRLELVDFNFPDKGKQAEPPANN